MLRFCESLAEVMFRFTNIIMYFAPVGVAGAMAFTVGGLGFGVLVNVGKLVLTLFVALTSLASAFCCRSHSSSAIPVMGFLRAVAEPATVAFATGASQAALPSAMEQMEAFGVPRRIVAFVIPAGLQLQPRRLNALSRGDFDLRRAGRRHSPVHRASNSS